MATIKNYFSRLVLLNHQIFLEKMIQHPRLFMELMNWKRKLTLTNADLGGIFDQNNKNKRYFIKTFREANELSKQFVTKLSKDRNHEFIKWFDNFLAECNFQDYWEKPLIRYISCGYYCPPEEMIEISINKDKNTISIEFGPEISKNDLIKYWPAISQKTKELKKVNRRRYSIKSLENLMIYIKSSELKKKRILKNEPHTDLEMIGELYPNPGDGIDDIMPIDEDKKLLNKMRVSKHRIKKLH